MSQIQFSVVYGITLRVRADKKPFLETLTRLFVELRKRMYQHVRDNPQIDIRIRNSRFVEIAEN